MSRLATTSRQPSSADTTGQPRLTAVDVAAVLSIAVGVVHLIVAPEHFADWIPAGVFFVALGAAQIAIGAALLQERVRTPIWAGVGLNSVVVLLYVIDRTASAGPIHDHDEHSYQEIAAGYRDVGVLDIGATIAEVIIVAALVTALTPILRRRVVNALLLIGLAAWAARTTGLLG